VTDSPIRFRASRVAVYALLILMTVLYLLPLYGLINTSFKTSEDIANGPIAPASSLYLGAYKAAASSLGRPLLNSAIVVVGATLFSTILGAMAGYVFSKFRFRGSEILFFLVILGFYLPYQAILIPLVRFMGTIHLFNTYFGLILTHTAYGVPITTLLFRNYYATIPNELLESASVDGCSFFSAFRRIMLPLSLPGFAVVGIFQFANVWNDYLFGLTLTQGVNAQPVTVAVANLRGTMTAVWNVQMAGAFLSSLPIILIYIFLLKLVVKGLLMGSVKG